VLRVTLDEALQRVRAGVVQALSEHAGGTLPS